jgi:hypothetical protein
VLSLFLVAYVVFGMLLICGICRAAAAGTEAGTS